MQSGSVSAPLGDEVDELLERAFLARPVEGPERRVLRVARWVKVGCVYYAEQVLQPELPTVLGVVAGAFYVEEEVADDRLGQSQQATVRNQRAIRVSIRLQKL